MDPMVTCNQAWPQGVFSGQMVPLFEFNNWTGMWGPNVGWSHCSDMQDQSLCLVEIQLNFAYLPRQGLRVAFKAELSAVYTPGHVTISSCCLLKCAAGWSPHSLGGTQG